MKSAKESFADEKAKLLEKRRLLLKRNMMEEYKELVADMIQKEEKVGADLR